MASSKIGVREMKNQATALIRSVREEGSEYVITVNGEPVALLKPFTEEDRRRLSEQRAADTLAAIDVLAGKIAAAWTSPKSGIQLVEEQRR